MKIGEAQKAYSARLQELSARRAELQRQHKENESAGRQQENEGVILELSSVEKQYQKASDFMSDFNAYRDMLRTMESAKRQKKTASKSASDMAKCLEIARRIARGDKVPAKDEKKLLEYNAKLYMTAKNMAVISLARKHKKHKSLWKDEEKENVTEQKSVEETVDDMECDMNMDDEIGAAL